MSSTNNPRAQSLEAVLQNITSQQKVENAERVEASNQKLREAEPKLSELTQPDAYREHVTDYLSDALDGLENGERDEVCDCPRPTCPAKMGEIPPQAETYDDLAEGLRAWRRDHIGNGAVFRDAREAFVEDIADVRSKATEAVVILDAEDPWALVGADPDE